MSDDVIETRFVLCDRCGAMVGDEELHLAWHDWLYARLVPEK